MGRLEVRVCGARNVSAGSSKPDSYVKINVGSDDTNKMLYKTRVVEKSGDPIFNELFKFQVSDYDRTQVLLEVWDDNVLKDDLLGSYRFSINTLTRGVVKDYWAILSGTKKTTAELHIRVLAVDFGMDPSPGETVVQTLETDRFVTPNQNYRPPKNTNNFTPTMHGIYDAPQPMAVQPVRYGAAQSQPAYGGNNQFSAYPPAPPQGGFSGYPPPPQQGGFSGYPPPPQQGGFGGYPPPPPQSGFGGYAPPPQQGGYPPPPQRGGYGGYPPPPNGGYGGVQVAQGVPPM